MRFYPNGPSIPSALIEQQVLGNVIFFCGAGISRCAGLPDFDGLTNTIIAKLNADTARKALQDNESFDRVFNCLIKEFGRPEIDLQIFNALKTPRKPVLNQHQAILDLSRSSAGNPQVVTTNFDYLFERTDKSAKVVIPPSLPDLSLGQPIDGIVYLHGRLARPDRGITANYVISSADFGRAYLADGWAARFVKTLRERYTIVLLGYSANDPPMRYLLEGLNAREDAGYAYPIYTFHSGDQGQAEEEWQDRGVTPICYDSVDQNHSGLWETLGAWARAAKDRDGWSSNVLALAQRKPSELLPCERGQVVHLVSSKAGAKLFADARPSPSAEWLCVFDANVRYAKPRRASFTDGEEIDPLDLYGLDDDPPRPIQEPNTATIIPASSALDWKHGDASFPERSGLRGWDARWAGQLPERLNHLARWFEKIMHEPAAIWWAAGWKSLNPNLLWYARRRLENEADDMHESAVKFWQLYMDSQSRPSSDYEWLEFERMVRKDGWQRASIRFLSRRIEPHVEFTRYSMGAPCPPQGDWTSLNIRQVVEPKVRVLDRHGHNVEVPSALLPELVALIRHSLLRASELLHEVGTLWWRMPTLYPTGERGESFHGRKEQYFLWFKKLFLALLEKDPEAAKFEVRHWPHNDTYFFGKLSIFAASFEALSTSREFSALLISISGDTFWDSYCQRELLFALRSRWPHLAVRQRQSIERRILAGPATWNDEKRGDYRKRKAAGSASRLRWLELNGCDLTTTTSAKLEALKLVDDRWSDRWAEAADDSLGPRGGYVERVTEVRGLDTIPISRIVAVAEERTEDRRDELRDYRPFEGLVASQPFRALSGLRFVLKQGKFPIRYWQNLLSEWPDGASLRLRWFLAYTVSRLPDEQALELRYYLPRWLEKHLDALAKKNRSAALAIFDAAVAPYLRAKPEQTTSSIGNTTIGGVKQDRSEVSIDKAINSPVGILAEALWRLLPEKASNKRPMPQFVGNRLKMLFTIPGNGGGHAACVVAQRMGWLDHCFRDWEHEVMLPLFDLSNPLSEAVWHGLAYDRNGLSSDTLKALNEPLLGMLRGKANWNLNESEHRQHVKRLVYLTQANSSGEQIISFAQAREVFVALDDSLRADAVWALSEIIKKSESWKPFVKPFLDEAWPRQVRFRSEAVSRSLARLAEESGDNFPHVVKVILPFLRPVAHLNMITYWLTKVVEEGTHDLARRFPEATLLLLDALIAEDRSQMPYELGKVLTLIGEAHPPSRLSKQWLRLNELAN
jgi:SIR2-like domain